MTITEQVMSIMKHVPATRSDDKLLCITYMQLSGMKLSAEQEDCFKRMPSLWSVRRMRQAIQEQGLYPATETVNEERYKQFKEHRENPTAGNSPPTLARYVPMDWREG